MNISMNETSVKPFVFVLMPFHSDFDDVYQVGIKAACASAGAYCERVDEQIFVENILDRVFNQIAKADIIVAEMTGRNPNVFYETGFAHALNKRVILLTQNADDIPFDLKQFPHIVYSGKITHLRAELEKRIKWCIANPTKPITKADIQFELVVNGVPWQEDLEIKMSFQPGHQLEKQGGWEIPLQIGLHNVSNIVIESTDYHLSLVTPRDLSVVEKSSDADSVTLSGNHSIIRFRNLKTVFPDDWNSVKADLFIPTDNLLASPTEFTIRLFSGLGANDYRFRIRFVPLMEYG